MNVWRVGTHQGQNLYEGSRFVGAMLLPDDAARIVAAMNGDNHFRPALWTNEGRLLFEAGDEVGYLFNAEDARRIVAVMNGAAS